MNPHKSNTNLLITDSSLFLHLDLILINFSEVTVVLMISFECHPVLAILSVERESHWLAIIF